jgi:hypothetical protein
VSETKNLRWEPRTVCPIGRLERKRIRERELREGIDKKKEGWKMFTVYLDE